MKYLVTGGYGFIGSALIRRLLRVDGNTVLNLDKISYASNLSSLTEVEQNYNYYFKKIDIIDLEKVKRCLIEFKPDYIFHLAAESHVDRSIANPIEFIKSNVEGTYNMLQAFKEYCSNVDHTKKNILRFVHISTDEVFGDLSPGEKPFTESSQYRPSSPYSASKASSDHLVKSWSRTYDLPCIVTNCSNNYGPFQNEEKLIPLVVSNALAGLKLPIYGTGMQIRDWLHVDDHVEALLKIAEEGRVGESYLIGGRNEINNLSLVQKICDVLDQEIDAKPDKLSTYRHLISFVNDRPGHDARYAINPEKLMTELNWFPKHLLQDGLHNTVLWYVNKFNQDAKATK